MVSSYKITFSLSVYHTYYENDICTCLLFDAAPSTSALLNKFGFKMRKKVNGFDLYFSSANTLAGTLDYIARTSGQDYFEFTMTTTNLDFPLFTALSSDKVGPLLFNSSSPSNQNVNGTIVLSETISPSATANETGKIKICFADILASQPGIFEIRLNAKATQWQYYIINKSAVQLDNPAISGKQEISFEGPENVTIPSGLQAILFSSGTNLLPLSEIPKYKFDLVDNSSPGNTSGVRKISAGKIIFKGLPNPDPGNTGIIMLNGAKQTASPIYVYV
jgi:hypothetical protein